MAFGFGFGFGIPQFVSRVLIIVGELFADDGITGLTADDGTTILTQG